MVKKAKHSISEEDCEESIINNNGKRIAHDEDNNKKKKNKTMSLYRQPTATELNRLQETENLFNSNLFRLQVEEVLEEVKLKEKLINKFQNWFDNFKTSLLSIPKLENEYDLSEKSLFKELKVKNPVGGELSKAKCSFKFHKFSDVQIVGSYKLGCSINAKLIVDIQVIVPANTYTKNDSVNYRYHNKRAAYLACIASHLRNLENIIDLEYFNNNCESKPSLIFKPNGKLSNHVTVQLTLACDNEAYKLHRFSPSRNNLRESWFLNTEDTNSEIGPPTPYYNSTVLSDLTSPINNKYLEAMLGNSDNLKQAIVLFKIWLRQRNIKVSGFVVNMFVAYLVQNKRINNIMSSYQIVRNVWISLKTTEWDTKGITIHKAEGTPSLQEFLQYFPVVFLDQTGYYNICWQMTLSTYLALKRESTIAIEMLDNADINSFIPLFMIPFKPLTQFDHILRFKDLNTIREAIYNKTNKNDKLNYGVEKIALITKTIYDLLLKGLGNRVSLILPLVNGDMSWGVNMGYDKVRSNHLEELAFGIILDTENAFETVHKGPSANLPEAEKFRAFWGEKSELRRFQDGSITETCVWEAETLADRRNVTKQIVQYLLKLKFDINSDIFYISDQLDSVLVCKQFVPTDGNIGTGEESALKVLQSFDELKRDLRSLADLPLDINSVNGISSVFSYSDPLPPFPRGCGGQPRLRGDSCLMKERRSQDDEYRCPPYIAASCAVIELGHSGKWPTDLQAFRCLKAAFHLQISETLTKQFSLTCQPHPTHIDVVKNNLIFRLEIVNNKEISLLKKKTEKGVVLLRENEESIQLQCRSVLMPRLRAALHGLHQRHPALGPTICLLKRFLSSHLIDDFHFPHTVLEVLSASVFLNPEPLTAPVQPLCGFIRVLQLLCDKDWSNEVLVVNLNGELNREEIMELEKNKGKEDIPRAMFIITPYDGDVASVWTRHAPSVNMLVRVKTLAKSALNYLEESLLKEFKDNVLSMFIPSLTGYDIQIHLHSQLVPFTGEQVHKRPRSHPLKAETELTCLPVLEYNPVRKYLQELRNAYSEFALFFCDMYGGDVIAVLWKPDIKRPREFQILNVQALVPKNVNGQVEHVVNIDAIIEDFRILGHGLVKQIIVN